MDQVKPIKFFALLVLIIALTAYTYVLRYRSVEKAQSPDLEAIPKRIGKYIGREEHVEPESLRMLGTDAAIFRSYRNGKGQTIWLFIGFFGSQQENSQIHSPKNCYPGSGWNIIEEGSNRIRPGERTVPLKHLV
ncbi:MAG: EpsI family protein, partial [Candidatus Krumholzibacteria bacterium]|nr:EpsI family protein [Candidatus Krumholzibacteria bacterium]